MPVTVKFKMLPDCRDLAPREAHADDAAYDLRSRQDLVISNGTTVLVPTGLFLEIPPGYEAQIRSRSGLALKNALSLPNAPGTIDAGYRGEGGVISIFARSVAEEKEITIFGDGEQTRDFIYAGDIAEGVAAALTTAEANVVYNLSTQTQTSLRELVDVLSNVAGRRIIPKYGPERPGDIYKSSLSNTRARRGLNWKPSVSLEEGLRRTYEYFVEKANAS